MLFSFSDQLSNSCYDHYHVLPMLVFLARLHLLEKIFRTVLSGIS